MVTKTECMNVILAEFPSFRKPWEEHLVWWKNESPGLSADMGAFSEYVIGLIEGGNAEEVRHAMILAERLMVEGSDEVRDACATSLLENLLNVTPGRIEAASYVPFLGRESLDYCRAWDKFTGVNTPGVTDEDSSCTGPPKANS